MIIGRKHITIIPLLLIAAGICLAAATKPKIQNILQDNTVTIPVVLVEFEDTHFTLENPVEKFQAQMEDVAGYFNSNFLGEKTFVFPVAAHVVLEYPIAKYGAPSLSFNDTDVRQLLADACNQAAGRGVDFSQYDSDNNGSIENIAIIYAGYSESEGGSTNSIWAHQQGIASHPVTINGVQVLSYTCTPELKGNSGASISPIGTFCHEICHYLGLPDMYDTNGDTEGLCTPMRGTLSIMDKGNSSNNGDTPPHFTSVEKELLGIGEIEEIVPGKEYTLLPANLSGKIYMVRSSTEGEYFLVECRENTGWDKFIGGCGMVIYHIDKSQNVYGGTSCAERWEFNSINSFASHPCARVLTAFDNTLSSISFNSNIVNLRDWNGNPTGTALTDIKYSAGKLTFKSVEDYSYDQLLPMAAGCGIHPYQNDVTIEWEPSAPTSSAGKWTVTWSKKDEAAKYQAITDTSYIWLQNLEPGCQYNIHIRHMEGMSLGKESSFKFKTYPITSSFPYIFVDKDGFRCGESTGLRIFNLTEKHISTEWFVDGEPIQGDRYTPEQEGEVTLEAVIYYHDGSEERIYKRIVVE